MLPVLEILVGEMVCWRMGCHGFWGQRRFRQAASHTKSGNSSHWKEKGSAEWDTPWPELTLDFGEGEVGVGGGAQILDPVVVGQLVEELGAEVGDALGNLQLQQDIDLEGVTRGTGMIRYGITIREIGTGSRDGLLGSHQDTADVQFVHQIRVGAIEEAAQIVLQGLLELQEGVALGIVEVLLIRLVKGKGYAV